MVHPDYIIKPFWELVLIYGYEWIGQQEEIFKRVYENKDS